MPRAVLKPVLLAPVTPLTTLPPTRDVFLNMLLPTAPTPRLMLPTRPDIADTPGICELDFLTEGLAVVARA